LHAYARGKRAELELARILWRRGFAVMRAPASGARAKRIPFPDILAVRYEPGYMTVLVVEVKLRRERGSIKIARGKAWRILDYARRSGGEAYVAVKVSSEGRWYWVPLEELEPRGDGYTLRLAHYDNALTLDEAIRRARRRLCRAETETPIALDDDTLR